MKDWQIIAKHRATPWWLRKELPDGRLAHVSAYNGRRWRVVIYSPDRMAAPLYEQENFGCQADAVAAAERFIAEHPA